MTSRTQRVLARYAPPALFILALLAAWEWLVRAFDVPRYLLVAPSVVAVEIANNSSLFFDHGWTTVVESVLGFALGSALGVVLAILVVHSAFLQRSLMPLIVGSQVVPKVAIAPLILLWIGYGMSSKVFIAATMAFFPVVVSHADGMNAVPKEFLDLARSMRAPGRKVFFKIRLPYSLPQLFSGLKVATSLAVIGAVVGEFVGASEGLGYLMIVANYQADTPQMFASLFFLIVLGVAMYAAVAATERLALGGRPKNGTRT